MKTRTPSQRATDAAPLVAGGYQLEDVARQVAEVIAGAFVPVFRGTKQGAGGFIADSGGVVHFLVRHDGIATCERLAPPGEGGVWCSPRADRVAELIPRVLPAVGGMTLKDAGWLATLLVGEQIRHAAAHPSPGFAFAGPVEVVMLSAAGAERYTVPLTADAGAI